jgi:hypothetical protein
MELRTGILDCGAPHEVSMGLLLLIVLVLLLLGGLPRWNHSRNWGYGPSGLLGVVLIVVVCIFLFEIVQWRTLSY